MRIHHDVKWGWFITLKYHYFTLSPGYTGAFFPSCQECKNCFSLKNRALAFTDNFVYSFDCHLECSRKVSNFGSPIFQMYYPQSCCVPIRSHYAGPTGAINIVMLHHFLKCCTLIVITIYEPVVNVDGETCIAHENRFTLRSVQPNQVTTAHHLIPWNAFDLARHLLHIISTTNVTSYRKIKCLINTKLRAGEIYLLNTPRIQAASKSWVLSRNCQTSWSVVLLVKRNSLPAMDWEGLLPP
jgi:hypothetical protein